MAPIFILLKAWMALWTVLGAVAGALAYAIACGVALEFSAGGVLIALAAGALAGAYASRTKTVRMMALRAGIAVGRRAVRRITRHAGRSG